MEREHPKIQVDDIEDILFIQNGIKDLISSYIQKYLDCDTDDELKYKCIYYSIHGNILCK